MEGYSALALDVVFPPRCVSCDAHGAWLCDPCLQRIELIRRDIKLKDTLLDGLVALGFYHDPCLRTLIHGLKYHLATCLVPSLGALMQHWSRGRLDLWPWAGEGELFVQPLVTSPARVRERGFDQSSLLAQTFVQDILEWGHVCSLLIRHDSIEAQAALDDPRHRVANIHGAFEVVSGQIMPSTVVLIDDVYTTGSTMTEAARVLKQAGVQHIYGCVLAMGQ